MRYVAVLDPAMKGEIASRAVMGLDWNRHIIDGAPALIIVTTIDGVCGYEKDGSFSTSKGTHWQSFDAGLAAEAFCLAAHEAGFGTVIMGIYDDMAVRKIAGVPEGQSVSALIAFGRPAENPPARPRKAAEELLSVR
ncbi:MAG: nitroreductase family protein [Pyramidobacter sp.]|nr:nitroreductase family protein [Pyramidobacter sp.]